MEVTNMSKERNRTKPVYWTGIGGINMNMVVQHTQRDKETILSIKVNNDGNWL